jgi:hypothetical protein
MNISNIVVEDTWISAKIGAELSESNGIIFKNVTVKAETGAPLLLNNVKNMSVSGFKGIGKESFDVDIKGKNTKSISLPVSLRNKVSENVKLSEIKKVK